MKLLLHAILSSKGSPCSPSAQTKTVQGVFVHECAYATQQGDEGGDQGNFPGHWRGIGDARAPPEIGETPTAVSAGGHCSPHATSLPTPPAASVGGR